MTDGAEESSAVFQSTTSRKVQFDVDVHVRRLWAGSLPAAGAGAYPRLEPDDVTGRLSWREQINDHRVSPG
jgi:hypothetical protein